MAERKQCKKCQKNKARLNSELCLECSLAEIAAGKMTDKPTNPPSEQELRDLTLRERGGAGVVKQENKVMDKTDEGKAQPGEPCCGRCGRAKSQVKLWIKKRQKCQNCLSAEIKERKKAHLAEGKAKKEAPQEEPTAKTQMGGGKPPEPRPKAAPTAREPNDSIVGQLQAKMLHHISEAEKIRETLTTIKELTGADFEIPETGI